MVPERADHPVVARHLTDFRVHTEQYWLATDPLNDVLATTTVRTPDDARGPSRSSCPPCGPGTWGAGRVFVSTVGHKPDDFDVPEVRTLTERGLLWASR